MDGSDFSLSMESDEDRQPQSPLAGRVIDTSTAEQTIRDPGPLSVSTMHRHPTPTENTFQQLAPSQHFNLIQFGIPSNNLHHPISPIDAVTNPLATILGHPDTPTHRARVCNYLQLTQELWTALFNPQSPSTVQDLLAQQLVQMYGKLPATLWQLITELRNQHDFEQWRNDFVEAISSVSTPHNRSRAPSWFSGYAGRSPGGFGSRQALHPSDATSPVVFQFSSPVQGHGSRTNSTSPVSIAHSGSNPQSPFKKKKGRAPQGYKYVCPYKNCKHTPFKNGGNINNHVDRCHAESDYRKKHPAEFLVPESPPLRDNGDGDEWPPSVATNASDSPLYKRNSSQEFRDIGERMSPAGQEGLTGVGDVMSPPSHVVFNMNVGQETFDQIGARAVSASSELASNAFLEGATFNMMDQRQQTANMSKGHGSNGLSEYSPNPDGPVPFGMFQMIEEKIWEQKNEKRNERRESYSRWPR